MPQQAATITSLSEAFEVVKEMQADGLEVGRGLSPAEPQGLDRDHRRPGSRSRRSLVRRS